jgi:hypothetical protein
MEINLIYQNKIFKQFPLQPFLLYDLNYLSGKLHNQII